MRRRGISGGAAWLLAAGLILVVAAGCGRREAGVEPGQDPQKRSQELIEAGNQAFRTHNYGLAARRYAAAAVVKKDDPAAYYGMGMALSKLGRDEDARKAYAKARELAQAAATASPVPASPPPGTH